MLSLKTKIKALEQLMDEIEEEAEAVDISDGKEAERLHQLYNDYQRLDCEYFSLTGRLYADK